MKRPRDGSLAKECTEVSTPDRTRNVPSSESEKVRIARKMVQILSASLFSMTAAECSSAVPASQGISEAFSTGSQTKIHPSPGVIGPVRTHRDAERQETPSEQRPWSNVSGPGGIDAAANQRRRREGEHNREADIAEIEQRRMDREARVLQQRIEVLPLEGCGKSAREGVGCEQNEEQEGKCDPALDRQRIGPQFICHAATKARHRGAEDRQD